MTSSSDNGRRHPACSSPTICNASSTCSRASKAPTFVHPGRCGSNRPATCWADRSSSWNASMATVWEQQPIPAEMEAEPGLLRRMCESMVDQLAAIHLVDLEATGLRSLADGRAFVEREIDRWEGEMRRVQRGPLPALERLLEELRRQQPEPSSTITLVHGDPKPGNFAFVGDEVSAVFDWELTDDRRPVDRHRLPRTAVGDAGGDHEPALVAHRRRVRRQVRAAHGDRRAAPGVVPSHAGVQGQRHPADRVDAVRCRPLERPARPRHGERPRDDDATRPEQPRHHRHAAQRCDLPARRTNRTSASGAALVALTAATLVHARRGRATRRVSGRRRPSAGRSAPQAPARAAPPPPARSLRGDDRRSSCRPRDRPCSARPRHGGRAR